MFRIKHANDINISHITKTKSEVNVLREKNADNINVLYKTSTDDVN